MGKGHAMKSIQRLAISAAAVLAMTISPGAASAQQVLKYGLINPPTHISVEMAQKFSDLLSEKTKGAVSIKPFPAQQLVRSDNWFEGVRLGTVDFSSGTMSMLEGTVPQITILDAPYLFKDLDHAKRVVDGAFTDELNKKLTKQGGVRILAWWLFGVRHLATTIPVYAPSDLAGKKVREVPSPVLLSTTEGMGANPVPLDWGEVYTSLQTGVVAGLSNPPDILFNAGLHEVLKYMAMTGHTIMMQAIVMNERKYQSFSPDVRKAIDEAAKAAAEWQWKTYIAQEKEFVEKLRAKGMTIVTEENGLKLQAFREQVHAHVVKKHIAQWGKETYDTIRADAAK